MTADLNAELQTITTRAATAAENWTEPVSHLSLVKPAGRTRMLGNSAAMNELDADISRAARSPHSVLIIGETGTGKTTTASMIHERSPRASQPFIAINCAAIPETLIESELFGYEKGAFTGAVNTKKGLFELAENGTLFLDEIGELKLELQAKLLTAVEQQTIRRLGGVKDIQCKVRIIAASSRDLMTMVNEKTFREDLYYRLAILEVPIAPLRNRRSDIPALVRDRLKHEQNLAQRNKPFTMEQAAVRELTAYDWPGNIRQLHTMISRLVSRADDGKCINVAAARKELTRFQQPASQIQPEIVLEDGSILLPGECRMILPNESLQSFVMRLKRHAIETVRDHAGSMVEASERLQFERSALTKLLARLSTNSPEDNADDLAA
jgi:transcriptional regulator with PAS, ATPase and Fis domain